MTVKVTKQQVTKYSIPASEDHKSSWASIIIDDRFVEGYGGLRNPFTIYIHSDYGNWTFRWSHPGDDWRKFLMGISMDYAATKFCTNGYFDEEQTERWLKHDIVEWRRSGGDKELAREAWEIIEGAVSDYSHSRDAFIERLASSRWADVWEGDFYDHLSIAYGVEPWFEQFWNGPWQSFIECIREERTNEQVQTLRVPVGAIKNGRWYHRLAGILRLQLSGQ